MELTAEKEAYFDFCYRLKRCFEREAIVHDMEKIKNFAHPEVRTCIHKIFA